jgi:hypothetical protein
VSKHIARKKWDEKTRLELVQSYILTGSLAVAAGICKVPLPTAKVWKQSQWFRDLELELRQGAKLKLSSKLNKIVESSMTQLADRIENGDYIWDKVAKEYKRKPITAEVAQKITAQLIDRTLQVEKAAQTGTVTDEGLDARLEKLRMEMKEFAKRPSLKPINESEIIDVIPQLVEESLSIPERQVLQARQEERPIRIAGSPPVRDDAGPPAYRYPNRTSGAGTRPDSDPSSLPADSSLRVTLG